MAYPQKILLTKHQREVLLHRLRYLSYLTDEQLSELWSNDKREAPLSIAALETALGEYDQLFSRCAGNQLIAISIERVEQAEALAEALEGSTYFATRVKGDGVYVHAANAVAELLSTILDRDVVPNVGPRKPHCKADR